MGYDFHITRRKDYFDDGANITHEEFVNYIGRDLEFTYPGENGENFADWRSARSGEKWWLYWSNGEIITKSPPSEFTDKMVTMARALQAKVQGDDGEVYLSATEIIHEVDTTPAASSPQPAQSTQWPLWKQLIAAFLIGCLLLGLKLLIFK